MIYLGSLKTPKDIPRHSDVLIIGGGIMGTATAYWLKRMAKEINVIVIERDMDVI